MKIHFVSLLIIFFSFSALAENGSRLWLPEKTNRTVAEIKCNSQGATAQIAVQELCNCWQGKNITLKLRQQPKAKQGSYQIISKKKEIRISASTEVGLLYASYHLLRLQQTGADTENITISETPAYERRLLNHWDNLDGTVERGYAGHSIWQWDELPETLSPRYNAYARANASIGINGTVLNNVNASSKILSTLYLKKVQAIANQLRPYGIRVYLSINFSSPAQLDNLPTSDPLNKEVQQWWQEKANEIYALIPDFGGFLVKANSEGLPGPQDYGRTHADGANMLAAALAPYGGIVMWRAFVYKSNGEDRAKQAGTEFLPLDGQFSDNVIIQVKNGPIDFQPREPFNPIFGAMHHTALMPEFQITQEYMGFSNHLVFLAPLYSECLMSDTYQSGFGTTVAQITTGHVWPQKNTAIAGVANIGEDHNWCGHTFAQANWYAFGRLAWNPNLTADEIAEEWLKQTFNCQSSIVNCQLKEMMIASREACVSYMMPLGLHHLFAWNHHYGPEPWCEIAGARPDWLPRYYHKADSIGIGFDRTPTGSNAVAQYHQPLCNEFSNIDTCPEKYLLWFHHVPWNYRMKNDSTLWNNLCDQYENGVQNVREFRRIWNDAQPYIDLERWTEVNEKLMIQEHDAVWWKNACLLYFQTFSHLPFPSNMEPMIYTLDELKSIKLDLQHHN